MSDFEESFQRALAATMTATKKKSLSLPKGIKHSIGLQAEGDARTSFEGRQFGPTPLPRGTSTPALKRHASNLWLRYHRDMILATPKLMFAHATSAHRYYIKIFVAAFQAEVQRSPIGPLVPKFKLGDLVKISGTKSHGEISFVGQYDQYLGQYRYKVLESDGTRKNWLENSLALSIRKD